MKPRTEHKTTTRQENETTVRTQDHRKTENETTVRTQDHRKTGG